jgi:signal recognition particle subunit SRP54
MSGQDAVNSAKAFNEQLELDGLILTKLDSDTRGGALLSAKMITGKPVKFLGVGRKTRSPRRIPPRRNGSAHPRHGRHHRPGHRAQKKFDIEEAAKLQAKMAKGQFTLDDFIAQMEQVRKLGPIGKVMGMIPGMSQLSPSRWA